MFKPQPTSFSSFYPSYASLPVEDNGVGDDLDFQVTDYCNGYYQQTPYAPLSGPLAPQTRAPGPGSGGDGRGGHDIGTAHAHGGAVTGIGSSAPPSLPPVSRVFPFHSSSSNSNSNSSDTIALFDNCTQQIPQQHQQQQTQPHPSLPQQQHFSTIPGAASEIIVKMEQSQSLQDELAAQEAAARTWQPELEVRYH